MQIRLMLTTGKNKLKTWLKSFPLLITLDYKIWSLSNSIRRSLALNIINVIQTFPLFQPHSAMNNYKDGARLTIEAINQVFPFLQSLSKSIEGKEVLIKNIEEFSSDLDNRQAVEKLKLLFDHYGSDKANHAHSYHHLYGTILHNSQNIENIFEIGLGTNNTDVVSNMGIKGKPGASLRAFRDYCPNASVYGADLDKRVLFEEDRIKTFFVDQTKPTTFYHLLDTLPRNFDLVIDDGLHSPHANIASLEFGLKIIKIGGWVVIEDIGADNKCLWQVVSSLLPNRYESHILSAPNAIVYAVKRLQ